MAVNKKIKAFLELTPNEWRLLIEGLDCYAQEATASSAERLYRDLAKEVERQLAEQKYDESSRNPLSYYEDD